MAPEDLDRTARERHSRTQADLINLLRADLDLARTLLTTAAIEWTSDIEHAKSAITKVRAALETVRQLETRVEDPATQQMIHDQADAVESTLERLVKPESSGGRGDHSLP